MWHYDSIPGVPSCFVQLVTLCLGGDTDTLTIYLHNIYHLYVYMYQSLSRRFIKYPLSSHVTYCHVIHNKYISIITVFSYCYVTAEYLCVIYVERFRFIKWKQGLGTKTLQMPTSAILHVFRETFKIVDIVMFSKKKLIRQVLLITQRLLIEAEGLGIIQ